MGNAAAVKFLVLNGLRIPGALFAGSYVSPYPQLSVQPLTANTVCPLTPSLFGPSIGTSTHGIINQPEAGRLDWPLWPLALQDFPLPYVCGSPRRTPLPMHGQRKKISAAKNNSTDPGPLQSQRSVWAAQFHILGPASNRNPTQGWLC